MAFLNFTAGATEKKPICRIFVKPAIGELEADMIESAQTIPSSGGWVQIHTGDGGFTLTPARTTTPLGNQQQGDTRLIQDVMEFTAEINISQLSLDVMQDLIILDPAATQAASHMSLRANRGTDITAKGITILVYDKQYDPTNETNVPDMDADAETIIIYKASAIDAPPIVFNNVAGTARMTFRCLVSVSTGSSGGSAGMIGAFTAV